MPSLQRFLARFWLCDNQMTIIFEISIYLNKMVKSSTKTAMKKVVVAVEAGDKAAAQAALTGAVSAIDRAYAKRIFHKNAAARKKSSLTRLVNSL